MKDVSHGNPYTGETTGQLFQRGPVVAADGGRREAVEPGDETAPEREGETDERAGSATDGRLMKDVDHTPLHDADDANRVFERGGRRARDVGSEE